MTVTTMSASARGIDIVMLTTVHRPNDVRIFHREAKTLAQHGFSVCIVASGQPAETAAGIRFEPLPTASNRMQRLFLGWVALARCLRLKAKLYIFHDPELLPVGLALRVCGKKVVYDCHENVAAHVLEKGYIPRFMWSFLVPALAGLLKLASRLLNGIIAATEFIAQPYPCEKTVVIRNFPPARVLEMTGGGLPIAGRENKVVYIGGLSKERGIKETVEAFRKVRTPGAELWLIGAFYDPAFQNEILSSLPANAKWFGRQPYRRVTEFLQLAKLGIVLHHDTPGHKAGLPIKLFEYLGAGIPVVASDQLHLKPIVEGCGIQVDPHDVEKITAALEAMLSDGAALAQMSRNGCERVAKHFSWEPEGQRLAQFCATLIN